MVETTTVSNRLRSPNFRSWLKKTYLVNAFAVVCLERIQEFHLWPSNTSTPNYPYQSLLQSSNQQNRTKVLFYYSMLICSNANACFEHSNFFKVKDPDRVPTQWRIETALRKDGRDNNRRITTRRQRVRCPHQISNYELFNCNNFNIRYWSWCYRGCWHQTCPQWILVKGFKLYSFQLPDHEGPVLLFIVTTSLWQDWVICAPAAFLRSGSRFSGSLSGIEP